MPQQRRGGRRRRKVDFIAANHIEYIDYKDTDLLKRFISERGKILPRRVTGTSAKMCIRDSIKATETIICFGRF